MTDDNAPYSGAIEETAKTAGKALDLVKDAAGPIADIYSIIIGDRIHAARHRRLDEITRKTKKILRDRNLSETAEVAEQIAIPLLEAAQREPREAMQDLWARLLANSMDPSRKDDVRPEFIHALEKFHPLDALVLHSIGEHFQIVNSTTPDAVAKEIGYRPTAVSISMENLDFLRCLRKIISSQSDKPTGFYKIDAFGLELLAAIRA